MTLGTLARRTAGAIITVSLLAVTAGSHRANAQNLSTGSLNVTVRDQAGAVVNGAQLILTDLATNDVHKAVTSGAGTAVIPYLNPASYKLEVSRSGFSSGLYPNVLIQTNQVTDLVVTLQVGSATQTITVSGTSTPLLQTTSDTLSTTVDMKEVQDLPLNGRDAFDFAFLVPGNVGMDFNNLPGGALNVSANGFSSETNRFKSAGFDYGQGSVTTNNIEDVQEMTVQTSQLGASYGGTSTMDIGMLTKRGTNEYHGDLFEDYRSDAMNANSWYNNAVNQPRGKLIINDFGGTVGGPILKNKFFFFAGLSNWRQPFTFTTSSIVGTPALYSGIYTYIPNGSTTPQTDNVLAAGARAGCSTCTATVNPVVATDIANIESAEKLGGATLTPLNLNEDNLNFENHGFTVNKYPTLRLDYDITPNFRWTGLVNETNSYNKNVGAPPFPGPLYSNLAYSNFSRGYQVVTGFDWNIRPALVNAFRVGYLYSMFIYNSQGLDAPTPAMVQAGWLTWGMNLNSGVYNFNALRGGSYYPSLSVKDDATWQLGRHTLEFGMYASTERDHYYNNQFVPYINTYYIAGGDPVSTSLDNSLPSNAPSSAPGDVGGLYATLNGRMTGYYLGEFVNATNKQFQPGISFNLHERLDQAAVYLQDSWRVNPSLTLNYGLRWDFTGASKDETGFYTHPNVANLWGPTPAGALFQPGNLAGVQNPSEGPASEAYAPTYVHPEPNFGVAWNPRETGNGWFDRFTGSGKTVFRISYSLTNYTEGAQNFWNFGSNNGANFNTTFQTQAVAPSSTPPGPGFFNAGSYVLGQPLPALISTSPIPYQSIITEASQGFSGTSYLTFDPHIKQPWVESWTVGIQRQLNQNNVLEVRYVGNVSRDQWLGVNYNEVNIFENGFLTNFKAAQANLAANGGTSFQGPNPTPLFDQAFAASGLSSNYTNGQFITYLQQGQAGAFANALAGNPTYLCSMINAASFSPCAANGYTGSGTYPINVFQANPYAAGAGIYEMGNDGNSNYNALEIDIRQQHWHGMQFDANYTLSHSLDNNVQGDITPGFYGGTGNTSPLGPTGGGVSSNSTQPGYYTLRDKHLNYFPSAFDVRHVLHVSGLYDLPFGHGQPFFGGTGVANAIIGGWTLGTILTYESGTPYLFTGGEDTFNQNDGVITLNGISYSTLKHALGIYHAASGNPWVNLLPAKYYNAAGQANTQYISPNFNAGTIGSLLWLHGPKWINTDMALTKIIPIHEHMNFQLQGEFLNAFNHPAWTYMDSGVQDYTFGTTNQTANNPRNVEVRGTFNF